MNREFYKSYVDQIRNTLTNGARRGNDLSTKLYSDFSNQDSSRGIRNSLSLSKAEDTRLFESLAPLSTITGKKVNYHLRPGAHPDFPITDDQDFENHYIISVFIDVKRSTGLFKKYNPVTVANTINTIQRAAVHTIWYHDGYVQRYHGDGLFAYFGGKSISIETAVKQALSATSFISYFMKSDLKNLFNEQGIENINTRIGIDTGDAKDILWYKAGMGECSEVTTCSIHTSLAAHMQGEAKSNGIVVGDNIKKISSVSNEIFDYVRDDAGRVSYAFEIPDESLYYNQWHFEWEKYIKTLPNVGYDSSGNMFLLDHEAVEAERIASLRNKALLINSGSAFTSRDGNISIVDSDIKNQPHRFHF